MKAPKSFLEKSENKAFSSAHRRTIAFNIGKYDAKVKEGKQQFLNLELARKLAKNTKWFAIENLATLLEQFEKNFTARGGKVIWAETAEEALEAIGSILAAQKASSVVKSKSMITEEIALNPFLEALGIEVVETDLGEYIVQLREEAPYHIVTPAMHLSKEEIASLFYEKFNTPIDSSPEFLTAFVRKLLRQKFEAAAVGITGANFMIAESGSIVLTENEGNARLATTFPKTHIAIVGLEKMLPSLKHLQLFLPLLATYGTGQQLTVYNTILSGPRQQDETDGPEEMYVIILDNGRSLIVEDLIQRQSLYCIRCGSCLNACPVYRTIGGHSYESPYGGPIGSVLMPNLTDFEDFTHLSHASSLCGSCTENCPMNIDLHRLLVHNRRQEVKYDQYDRIERSMWNIWKKTMLHRSWMNAPSFSKNLFVKLFFRKAWGSRRNFPAFPALTFNQIWNKNMLE